MFSKQYKIAVIDQKGNIGGGSKFTNKLIYNFDKYHSNVKIDLYSSPKAIESIQNKNKYKNVTFKKLQSLKLKEKGILSIENSGKILKQLQDKFFKDSKYLNYYFSGNLKKELEKRIRNYDVAFFVWPYLIDFPIIKTKKVIVLHDLLFKYNFDGLAAYNLREINLQNFYLEKWIKDSDIIVTSNFMKKEILKFYPNFPKKKYT